MNNNILLTGNNGYIGSILTEKLLQKGYRVIGLDTNFYQDCFLIEKKHKIPQIVKDIRHVSANDLKNVQAVIHLAALSNDPLGEFNKNLTYEINYESSVRLAKLAKKAGVKRFIYASSQSIYGISETKEELDEEKSKKNPLSVYAETKWKTEIDLKRLNTRNFTVVCFRPSTVFGGSPYLRCDIVFNNLLACAFSTGKIEIKSDGTPWRPIVHIQDVSQAFISGLEAPEKLVSGESFNVGIKNGNYTVSDLAKAAKKLIPGTKIVYTGEHGKDSRSYKVSFEKILNKLKDYYKPEFNLDLGGKELLEFYKKIKLNEKIFRSRKCNRLIQLKYLLANKKINPYLYWKT